MPFTTSACMLLSAEACRPPGQVRDAGHFVVGAARHPVMVVEDQENDRYPEAVIPGEFVGELNLRGEIQGLEHDSIGVGTVARETADHGSIAQVPAADRGPGCDGHAAADDGVGSQVADREVGDVHAAASSFAVAVFLAEEFGERAVDVVLQSLLEQFRPRCGLRVGDALSELRFIHGPNGAAAARQTVAVAAVRAGDVVLEEQRAACPYGGGFLADRDMSRPPVFEIPDGFVRSGPELHDHFFHLASHEHVFQEIDCRPAGNPPGIEFRPQISPEPVRADLAAIDLERLEIRS